MIDVKYPSTLLCAIAGFLLAATTTVRAADDEQPINYGRDIRPLLSDRCFSCHGPDASKREAELRLDERDSAVDSAAIVPSNPQESSLIERILSDDPDEQMPPPDANKKPFTPAEIKLLQRWIAGGAAYSKHWAYAAPKRPPLPDVKTKNWSDNPVDRFIAAAQERQALQPSPPADRRTLIRRLSFDLTGLPPTPQEVDAFLNHKSADAYGTLVERLLKSPHFGERLALYWLDLVRFADTAGYHSDNFRDLSAYRDYVVTAFNNNKPFDQFTIEQLAGDLLPESGNEQKIASGYNRLLQTTEEGGAQQKEYQAIYQADRVRNFSTVWLGTTLGCCQCHDHKFDPFTMRDFYSLGSFFADLKEKVPGRQAPNLLLPTPQQTADIERLQGEIQTAETAPVAPEDLQAWATEVRKQLQIGRKQWTQVTPTETVSTGRATFKILDDRSVLTSGKHAPQDDYTIKLETEATKITGIRLEALTHDSLSGGGLSRANGNFVLTDFAVQAATGKDATAQPVKITAAVADFQQPGFDVKFAIDDKPKTGWAVAGHERKDNRTAVFTFAEPITGGAGTTLTVSLRHQSDSAGHNIGRFRLSLTTAEKPGIIPGVNLPTAVIAALDTDTDQWTDAARAALIAQYRIQAPALEERRKQIADWKKQLKQTQGAVQTMLVSQSVAPREIRILPRGNWLDDSGEVVTPATPGYLPPLGVSDRRATRLDLARWVVSAENPLTGRVFVNRLWYLLYGSGLSRSLEDVGHQGRWPSHPQLLDWLAVEFRDSGWDVKHLIRLIVSSQTYRQTSVADASILKRDPDNQWLTRQNRVRLDAEFIRDNALALSGLLVRDMGRHRSVKPYQPAGFWRHLNFPARTYQADSGIDQHRRSLYTYWCRTFPHPSLTTFDAPSREECIAQRPRSNTPLQALVLLNDPIYVEASRGLAQRIIKSSATNTKDKIRWAFREVLSRKPTAEELRIVQAVYEQERTRFTKDAQAAEQLTDIGQSPVPKGIDLPELAAWTAVTRVMLNLHETISRY